jgi:hypothetical protein
VKRINLLTDQKNHIINNNNDDHVNQSLKTTSSTTIINEQINQKTKSINNKENKFKCENSLFDCDKSFFENCKIVAVIVPFVRVVLMSIIIRIRITIYLNKHQLIYLPRLNQTTQTV